MQKVAIVQESPVLLDRDRTMQLAVGLVEQAAKDGAGLVVFPGQQWGRITGVPQTPSPSGRGLG